MRTISIVCLIGLVVLVPARGTLADVAGDLSQAEERYKAGQYTQAEQSYLKVINEADPNKPTEADAAFTARKKLPLVCIATDRLPQAKDAVQQLLSRHAQYEFLPHAIHEIVEGAKDLNKTAQAGQAYREILNAQPGHSQAIWLKMGIAVTDVYLGNGQGADAGVKDIIARHSTDPRAAESLAQIGWAYDKLSQYAKARPLYEYVVDNWSDKPRTIYAHTALVRDCIRLRDKQAAQGQLEQLAKRYATNPQLPNVLNEIARGYREVQMYQEARPISRHILDSYSGHNQCIWAQRDIILCDVGERSQDTAQAGLQTLIKNYADNGYLPYVLNEIAAGYRRGGMCQQAKSVSQYVLDNFRDSDQCLWAQRDVVLSDLALGNLEAAAAGIKKLESRFAKQPGVIWAISEMAETCSKLGRHEQARDLFRFNVYNCPDLDDTIWSLRGFVAESAALKDETSIDAGIKKLLSEYSASKNLPMAAVHVGRDLLRAGQSRASELFQYVIDKHPDHDQALFAKVCMGHIRVRQGDDQGAEAIFQKVLTDYANHPRLIEAANLMAEGYYNAAFLAENRDDINRAHACFRAAIAKWKLIPQGHDSIITPQALNLMAESYSSVGELQNAVECYRKLVAGWPDYEYTWSALYKMGDCYLRLAKTGAIPEGDAMIVARDSFERVLRDYPNCRAAKAAQQRLTFEINSSNND
jgi:TolA-binding protein